MTQKGTTVFSFNIRSAHKFVSDQRRLGNDVRWDNYDIVFWRPTHHGFTHVNGVFRKGRWGMETRIPVGNDGFWRVPRKYVKKSVK
jgi:hypothetical protein